MRFSFVDAVLTDARNAGADARVASCN